MHIPHDHGGEGGGYLTNSIIQSASQLLIPTIFTCYSHNFALVVVGNEDQSVWVRLSWGVCVCECCYVCQKDRILKGPI